MHEALRGLIVILVFVATQAIAAPPALGVLVGIHRTVDFAMQHGPDRQPRGPGDLRTLWLSAGNTGPIAPSEISDLLLPRRDGFWRLGLLGTCAEEPHRDVNDKVVGVEAVFDDRLWAVPIGRRPQVRVESRNSLDMPVRIGRCASADVYCDVDARTEIHWVWPDYVSLNAGRESGCGAHPSGSVGYSIQRPEDLGRELTIGDVLGADAQRRFEAAFAAAAKAPRDCAEQPRFRPESWHIVRVPGGWKAEGWSETDRLCGYGVNFTAEVELSRITRRKDSTAQWAALKRTSARLTDAHFSPDGSWILATEPRGLHLFRRGHIDPVITLPLEADDDVVMVEWAIGTNVARWSAEVARARSQGAVSPVVIR